MWNFLGADPSLRPRMSVTSLMWVVALFMAVKLVTVTRFVPGSYVAKGCTLDKLTLYGLQAIRNFEEQANVIGHNNGLAGFFSQSVKTLLATHVIEVEQHAYELGVVIRELRTVNLV